MMAQTQNQVAQSPVSQLAAVQQVTANSISNQNVSGKQRNDRIEVCLKGGNLSY